MKKKIGAFDQAVNDLCQKWLEVEAKDVAKDLTELFSISEKSSQPVSKRGRLGEGLTAILCYTYGDLLRFPLLGQRSSHLCVHFFRTKAF